MSEPSDAWIAAAWCRANGVRRGSLVGVSNQSAGYSYEVVRVTNGVPDLGVAWVERGGRNTA